MAFYALKNAIRVWHICQDNTGIASIVASRISVAVGSPRKGKRNFLGPFLKTLREAKRVTQAELTTLLQLDGWDLSRQVLAFVEDGTRILSDVEIFAILRALGHNPEILKDAFDDFCKQRSSRKDGRAKR